MTFYIERFKNIEKKEFEMEIVTPLLMGGADSRKAELRVPSIKGVLRFWWRALYPHLSLEDLKKEESKIFGDAGTEYGKSKVQIKMHNTLIYRGKDKENPVPHKKVKFGFPCFNPGQTFSLQIYGNRKVFDIFNIALVLGGFGKRSRRGFGSVKINKVNGAAFKPIITINEILSLLESTLVNKFKIEKRKIVRNSDPHPQAEYAYIKSIEFGPKVYHSREDILRKIGQSSHDNNSDYTGYAKGRKRFSSPIYVSVVKNDEGYCPIITTLNVAFINGHENHGRDKSQKFKNDILSGGSQ